MSGAQFTATISAQDKVSDALAKIAANTEALARKMGALKSAEEGAVKASRWQTAVGWVRRMDTAVGGVVGRLSGMQGRLAALVPPLAALGGIGALGGVFKLTEEVADKFTELQHSAQKLGVPMRELARLRFVARQTDTDVGALDTAFGRLGAGAAAAAMGKNKNLAGLFQHLGISLRDGMTGAIRAPGAIMDDVFKAFEVNKNPAVRELLARTLFGRGGIEIIPMLTRSREELKELFATFERVRLPISAEDGENLERYHRSWMVLSTAVGTVATAIGVRLAPVLRPVLDHMTDWIVKNREWIATGIAGRVQSLATYLQSPAFVDIVETTKQWAIRAGEVFDKIGGLKTVLEIKVGIKIASWTASAAEGFIAIGTAIAGIATAIKGMDSAISGSMIAKFLGPAAAFAYFMRPAPTQTDEDEGRTTAPRAPQARSPIQRFFDAIPSLSDIRLTLPPPVFPLIPGGSPSAPGPDGALRLPHPGPLFGPQVLPSPSLAPGRLGEAPAEGRIVIDINGAPPGTTATVTDERGVSLAPRVNGDTGSAFSTSPGWAGRRNE